MSNYMLYNFHDTPADLFERMRLNVTLNEELGLRIWSFPMRYQPTWLPDRSHIGEKWTRYQLRSMQLILQATHGVVSGEPTFFKRAFGDTFEEFDDLLMRPHHFIFNRDWFEIHGGRDQFCQFQREFKNLSSSDRAELLSLIGSVDPSNLRHQLKLATASRVKSIMKHYLPLAKDEEAEIWARQRAMKQPDDPSIIVPDEERVEDAGLNYEEPTARAVNKDHPQEKGYGHRMSTNLVPITSRESAWQTLASEIVIGKDILELLSSSMYVDPMTIYREYIQNAADSIEEARASGLLGPSETGTVGISDRRRCTERGGHRQRYRHRACGICRSPYGIWREQKAGARGAEDFVVSGDLLASVIARNWSSVRACPVRRRSAKFAGTAAS